MLVPCTPGTYPSAAQFIMLQTVRFDKGVVRNASKARFHVEPFLVLLTIASQLKFGIKKSIRDYFEVSRH